MPKPDSMSETECCEYIEANPGRIDDEIDEVGNTLLMYAIMNSKMELITFLLNKGASIDVDNHLGENAFSIAISKNNEGIITQLMSKIINYEGQYSGYIVVYFYSMLENDLFHVAENVISDIEPDCLSELLELLVTRIYGCETFSPELDRLTKKLLERINSEDLNLLIPNIINPYEDSTPLMIVLEKIESNPEYIGLAELLIEKGADPNLKIEGKNLLVSLLEKIKSSEAIEGPVNLVLLLLKYIKYLDCESKESLLELIVEKFDEEPLVKFLLKYGNISKDAMQKCYDSIKGEDPENRNGIEYYIEIQKMSESLCKVIDLCELIDLDKMEWERERPIMKTPSMMEEKISEIKKSCLAYNYDVPLFTIMSQVGDNNKTPLQKAEEMKDRNLNILNALKPFIIEAEEYEEGFKEDYSNLSQMMFETYLSMPSASLYGGGATAAAAAAGDDELHGAQPGPA